MRNTVLYIVGCALLAFLQPALAENAYPQFGLNQVNCYPQNDVFMRCSSVQTITAKGGPLTLERLEYTGSSASAVVEIDTALSTCYEGLTLQEESKCELYLRAKAFPESAYTMPFEVEASGAVYTFLVMTNRRPLFLDIQATPSGHDFGLVPVGQSSSPKSFIVKFNRSGILTGLLESTEFHTSGTCNLNHHYTAGKTCTLTVTFKPTAPGPATAGGSALRIIADTKHWSGEIYLQGIGADGTWQTGEWSACSGGAGEWLTGPWTPTTGCGLTEQSRTATCAMIANSGVRTRNVTCMDGNGQELDLVFCMDQPPPAASESCTPMGEASCGEPPLLSRTISFPTCDCVPDPANNMYCLKLPL